MASLLPQFVKLDRLEAIDSGSVVDVLGVIESVEPLTTIRRKDGSETEKRSLTLRDETGRSVEFSLWGGFAHNPGKL